MQKIKVIAVVGPTASGKTALAVAIAKKYNGEIVSADSMQIYKGMNIASAKPTDEEKQGIVHHLIDCKNLDERYSVGQFVNEAKYIIFDIASRNKLPVICGGTGLYVDSLINNIKFIEAEYDENIRVKLNERLSEEGVESLFNELKTIDSKYADSLLITDAKRILRALELYYSSGVKMSEQIEKSTMNGSPFEALYIGIKYNDRQLLYDRINLRVERMIENGLIKEAKEFFSSEKTETANQAIGIKELKEYLDGNENLEDAVEKIKMRTRQYAKRQLTWFNKNKNIQWLYPDSDDNINKSAFVLIDDFCEKEIDNERKE